MYINSSEGIGFITNVSVDIEYKGHGVASKLMDQVKEYASKNSIETIELEVYQENIKAINFYHKHGFTTYGSTSKTLLMFHKIERNYNQEFKDTADHKYAYNFDFDVMHHYMIESFKPHFIKGNCLELGSFKGDFTKRLIPYFDDITCVEASDEAIKTSKQNLEGNITYYNSLFENVKFKLCTI